MARWDLVATSGYPDLEFKKDARILAVAPLAGDSTSIEAIGSSHGATVERLAVNANAEQPSR